MLPVQDKRGNILAARTWTGESCGQEKSESSAINLLYILKVSKFAESREVGLEPTFSRNAELRVREINLETETKHNEL